MEKIEEKIKEVKDIIELQKDLLKLLMKMEKDQFPKFIQGKLLDYLRKVKDTEGVPGMIQAEAETLLLYWDSAEEIGKKLELKLN